MECNKSQLKRILYAIIHFSFMQVKQICKSLFLKRKIQLLHLFAFIFQTHNQMFLWYVYYFPFMVAIFFYLLMFRIQIQYWYRLTFITISLSVGHCPVYNTVAKKMDSVVCSGKNCPKEVYRSDAAYKCISQS